MIDKKLVRDRFSKNLEKYNEHARIQKRMAERLFSFIPEKKYKRILEIGCGTGFLTKLVNENIDFDEFIAVDIVENCERYIVEINSNIKFVNADIEDFMQDNKEPFDLIISNATLQWVDDFKKMVNLLQCSLAEKGELIFSTFGKENFREIYHVLGTTLNYYSEKEILEMFPSSIIDSEVCVLAFANPKEVLKHLQMTGVNAVENRVWTKTDLMKFENGYKNICSKRPTLTYNPIYIKIS